MIGLRVWGERTARMMPGLGESLSGTQMFIWRFVGFVPKVLTRTREAALLRVAREIVSVVESFMVGVKLVQRPGEKDNV